MHARERRHHHLQLTGKSDGQPVAASSPARDSRQTRGTSTRRYAPSSWTSTSVVLVLDGGDDRRANGVACSTGPTPLRPRSSDLPSGATKIVSPSIRTGKRVGMRPRVDSVPVRASNTHSWAAQVRTLLVERALRKRVCQVRAPVLVGVTGPSMLHSRTSTAPRFTAHISPSQTSSSVPASNRHRPLRRHPRSTVKMSPLPSPACGDRRVGIEHVACLVAHRQRPAPLGCQSPGDQLIGQLGHGACRSGVDDDSRRRSRRSR